MSDTAEVRRLSAAEVHVMIDWARQEGWNPGLADAACFHAADPDGFFGTFHEGSLAAVVSAVRYGNAYGFVGLHICRPELRGRGFGTRVWNSALRDMSNRTLGLDAVDQQRDTYARLGFRQAWDNYRFRGQGGGVVPVGIVDLDTVPFAHIAAYDRDVFEADRRRFLRAWIAQPDAVRLGVVRDGALVGWGLLRRCGEGRKIGPLVADDPVTAELLLDGLLAAAPHEPVFLDVPEPNAVAMRAAEAHGMTPVFRTARMYRGAHPPIDLSKVWGVTTFELG